MAATARMVVERRAGERYPAGLDGRMRETARKTFDVVIENLSLTGLSMTAVLGLTCGDELVLEIAGLGERSATIVRHVGNIFGCEFTAPLSDDQLSRVLNPRSATLIQFPTNRTQASGQDFVEPVVKPYPLYQRGWLLVMLGAGSWAVVIWAISLALAT